MPAARHRPAPFTRLLLVAGTIAATAATLSSCGGGDAAAGAGASVLGGTSQGTATPFIRQVQLSGVRVAELTSVRYTIAAKTGAASKPVSVSYSIDALRRRGSVDDSADSLTLSVFGLYANHANQVAFELTYDDSNVQTMKLEVDTDPYVDPNGLYDHPTVLQARAPGSALGFDYLALKNMRGGPIIIDTDGAVRWVAPAVVTDSTSTAFTDNGFEIGAKDSTVMTRVELDGTSAQTTLAVADATNFHHNIDHGKTGLLVAVDRTVGGVKNLESTLAEVNPDGSVIREWDLAALIANHMSSRGDDPSAFVRPGVDWLHNNASAYDPNDDSIIVSSRENFVVKFDYTTGNIIWILGDPTKYWYTFASLREKAVTLQAGDLYPIGQHAISVTAAGELMLFNNGLGSLNEPAGAPAGQSRTYSAVSTYSIDPSSLTAHEVARFDHGQTILSDICSSAYEAGDRSLLVNYAVADNRTLARVIGLDPSRNVMFDFEYPSPPSQPCSTSWNAVPVPLDNMTFQ